MIFRHYCRRFAANKFRATHSLKFDRGVSIRVANVKGVWRDKLGDNFGFVTAMDERLGYVKKLKKTKRSV